jgi:hypothetical protein
MRERNRTVSRFTHRETDYTIHERTNYHSDGKPCPRRFIMKTQDGGWDGEANNVKEARKVLDQRHRMMVEFVGTCVNLQAEDLDAYDESAHDISYKTFLEYVGKDVVREQDEKFGVPLGKDWHVSFSRGEWKGEAAVCLFHSRIHHIWKL